MYASGQFLLVFSSCLDVETAVYDSKQQLRENMMFLFITYVYRINSAPPGTCRCLLPLLPSSSPPQIEVLVCTNEQRKQQWEGYRGWLERRGKERYNVIIDGANVGYFKQNAAGAGELADLRQVDWAVKKYEAEVRKYTKIIIKNIRIYLKIR